MLNISSKTYSLILYLVCCTMNGKKADPASRLFVIKSQQYGGQKDDR